MPIFGICLGHQMLALALGGKTEQDAARPSRRQPSGQGPRRPARSRSPARTTASAWCARACRKGVKVTHVSLFDGMRRRACELDGKPVFSVQYHPEASPGPQDSHYLFQRFVEKMAGAEAMRRQGDRSEQLEMPKRTDIKSILIIGAGPIVIGQACEFDYSGAQACKALRQEGYRVILVNSNPATIMTDPDLADATYIEPITPDDGRAHHRQGERPDALLPTMGGQTALNTAMALHRSGKLEGARRRADRRQCRGDRHGRGPPAVPRGDGPHRPREPKSAASSPRSTRRSRRWSRSACPRSSARASPSAAPAAASPTTARNSSASSKAASRPRRSARCWSRNRCSAGRSSRWRWSATARTTASSSARSRTSIRWACIPAIASPSRRR